MRVSNQTKLGNLGALGAGACGNSTTFIMAQPTLAKPCSDLFLGKFQGLQRALNAYILRHRLAVQPLNVDGNLGPRTLGAAQAASDHGFKAGIRGFFFDLSLDVKTLADQVDTLSAMFAGGAGRPVDATPVRAQAFEIEFGTAVIDRPKTGAPGTGFSFGRALVAGAFAVAAYRVAGALGGRG